MRERWRRMRRRGRTLVGDEKEAEVEYRKRAFGQGRRKFDEKGIIMVRHPARGADKNGGKNELEAGIGD